MLKRLLQKICSNKKNKKEKSFNMFKKDDNTGLIIREYENYNDYLTHQASKFQVKYQEIVKYDKLYEEIIFVRYKNKLNFKGKTMLCLAARLGGEVRAFKRLGAVAFGIDIEPGPKNPHVIYGDFHDLQYQASSFDYLFCNAIDHVYDLDKFLNESARILRSDGIFLLEIALCPPGKYDTLDTSDIKIIKNCISKYFQIINEEDIVNSAGFANWEGKLLVIKPNISNI